MNSPSLLRERVLAAARKWWEGHRPKGWTERDHLSNPTINITEPWNDGLARAVAALVKESWRKDDTPELVRDLLNLARELDKRLRMPDEVVFKKHEIYRRAEVFLGLREVRDDTHPVRPQRRTLPQRASERR